MASDWDIAKATGKCAVSGQPFAEGESYFAVLIEGTDGLERRDYSLDAWDGPPENTFCYWRARVPVREKKPTVIAVDQNVLVHLFRKLEDEEAELKQQFRFVLALLLMRKKRLKMVKTFRQDGKEYWNMLLADDKSEHVVHNPHMTAGQIDQLSEKLKALLSGEVEVIEDLGETGATLSEQADIHEEEEPGESGDNVSQNNESSAQA